MTEWPRDAYVAAVWRSTLDTYGRMAALAYARSAASKPSAWLSAERLAADMGASLRKAKAARQALVSAGWLTEVEPARQHRVARYRLTVPVDNPAQGCTTCTSGQSQGCTSCTSEDGPGVHGTSPGVHETTSRGARRAPDSSEESTEESASAAPAREIVVIHNGDKPTAQQLADQWMTYRPLDNRPTVEATVTRACDGYPPEVVADGLDRLLAEGRTVTPGQLDIAITHRQKDRATVALLEGIRDTPPTPPCSGCEGTGWLDSGDEDRPRPCPTCKPHLHRKAAG